jgi:hypothetical protein
VASAHRKWHLIFALLFAVLAASAGSHLAIRWLKIRAGAVGYHHYGPAGEKARAVLFGSSLAYDGLNWQRICEEQGGAIESWATPGSSPAEWEVYQRRSPDVTQSFVVISAYDMNEYWLCDYRAEIVPLKQTWKDLWHSHVSWAFRKRILSQYAEMYVRKLFPTVGRSDGVMVGVRGLLRRVTGHESDAEEGDAPRFGFTDNTTSTERVTEWSAGHLLRRLSLMRNACEGKSSYDGPKRMALARLLERAAQQGRVTLVVMPVSPIYHRAFLNEQAAQAFENELSDMKQRHPGMQLLRLDQIADLYDDNKFRDFVHLNKFGDEIATASFLSHSKMQWSRR